jgi:hypothetical protein
LLTSVDLSGNGMGVEGAKALAPAIAANGSLTSLNLNNNHLFPEGAKAVAPALAANGSLTSINLKYNKLGDEGWCAVFDDLRDNPQNKIAEWDLDNQGINLTIIKSLAAYVAVSGGADTNHGRAPLSRSIPFRQLLWLAACWTSLAAARRRPRPAD